MVLTPGIHVRGRRQLLLSFLYQVSFFFSLRSAGGLLLEAGDSVELRSEVCCLPKAEIQCRIWRKSSLRASVLLTFEVEHKKGVLYYIFLFFSLCDATASRHNKM